MVCAPRNFLKLACLGRGISDLEEDGQRASFATVLERWNGESCTSSEDLNIFSGVFSTKVGPEEEAGDVDNMSKADSYGSSVSAADSVAGSSSCNSKNCLCFFAFFSTVLALDSVFTLEKECDLEGTPIIGRTGAASGYAVAS